MIFLIFSIMSERASCKQYDTDAYTYAGYFLMAVALLAYVIVSISNWIARENRRGHELRSNAPSAVEQEGAQPRLTQPGSSNG